MKLNLFIKKNSDKILLGTGLVGLGVGIVMACKATLKVAETTSNYDSGRAFLENNKQAELEAYQTIENEEEAKAEIERTLKEYKKKERELVLATAGMCIKYYIPAVFVIGGSVGCILGSHNILTKRNAALSAAYATVDQAFKDYRKKVIEKYGEDVDAEVKDGVKAKKLKEGETEKTYTVINEQMPSMYALYFDESNPYWEGAEKYNDNFLQARLVMFQQRLDSKGCLFLNEVRELLGFDLYKPGQIVGWVKKNDPNAEQKSIMSIKKIYQKDRKDPIYLLDFDVDGNVLDLI